MDKGKIQLIGGLWSIFIFTLTYRPCGKIYPEPGETSSEENF